MYVLRNNELAAVILSSGEYEFLKEAEEILDHLEINETVRKRMARYDRSKNTAWEKVRKKHGL